jgi:hypothetical protein
MAAPRKTTSSNSALMSQEFAQKLRAAQLELRNATALSTFRNPPVPRIRVQKKLIKASELAGEADKYAQTADDSLRAFAVSHQAFIALDQFMARR